MSHNGSVQTLDAVRRRLNYLHDTQRLSWRKIAALNEYSGIPHGTLCSIASGREPKDEEQRRILGLPPNVVEVQPCPDCGQLHEQKATCPHDLEKQRQGPKPHRRAAYFGTGEEGRELAEAWDAMAEKWEGMTGLARGLLDGCYIVEEVEK